MFKHVLTWSLLRCPGHMILLVESRKSKVESRVTPVLHQRLQRYNFWGNYANFFAKFAHYGVFSTVIPSSSRDHPYRYVIDPVWISYSIGLIEINYQTPSPYSLSTSFLGKEKVVTALEPPLVSQRL